MVTREQNDLLTRVEGDAPMGKLMRENYWIPACVSTQLIADGAPLRIRLLGKDYVAFRDTEGRIGFLDERCPHRGVSLVLGRNEKCGLRCIFHGWKIDVTGKVVDVPTHAPNPQAFAAKIKVNHYPTHEGGGIVWAWLGANTAPKFPELPFTILPASQVWMTVTKAYCNWLQGLEGTVDSAHVGTLHAAYMTPQRGKTEELDTLALENLAPRYEVERKPYGLDAIAHRPLPDGTVYVRTTNYLMPFIALTPFGGKIPGVAFIVSPIDDTHHNLFYGIWSPTDDINDGKNVPAILATSINTLTYDPHNYARLTGNRDHNYGQDRAAMKEGHFSGFTGSLLQEDMVTQASMGPIVDRTLDNLSSSDVAVIRTRRLLLECLDKMANGQQLPGAGQGLDFRDVIPESGVASGTPTAAE